MQRQRKVKTKDKDVGISERRERKRVRAAEDVIATHCCRSVRNDREGDVGLGVRNRKTKTRWRYK